MDITITISLLCPPPNGVRYLRVGERRQRRFDETSLKPRNRPENAATPTRRVHAVLGGFLDWTGNPLSADSSMKTYFPWRIKMIAQLSAAEEIIAGAATCQALDT